MILAPLPSLELLFSTLWTDKVLRHSELILKLIKKFNGISQCFAVFVQIFHLCVILMNECFPKIDYRPNLE